MARLFVLPTGVAETACRWVCGHRTLAACLAVVTHPELPGPIAADSVEHTWESYSGTLDRVILASDASAWLGQVRTPVVFVVGDDDPVVDVSYLEALVAEHEQFVLQRWDGDHHLPLTTSRRCVDVIERLVTGRNAFVADVDRIVDAAVREAKIRE